MIITTTEIIPGYEIERIIGLVDGSSVKTVHLGKHIRGFFKRIIGGELTYYSDLMDKARNEACKRMIEKAEKMGADAVIGVRYVTTMIAAGASEIIAYGTAVKLKR